MRPRLRARVAVVLVLAAAMVALAPSVATAASVATGASGDIGYEDFSWAGTGSPTAQKRAESVLWWNDGSWWANMWNSAAADFHIYRFDDATQAFVDTGVLVDSRSYTHADVLWDGTHLYVASHKYISDGGTAVSGYPAYLYRFSYDRSTRTYSLDAGFPVQINDMKTETLVIDKDSSGTLWATWTQNNAVYVNHTIGGDDHTWSTPFIPPIAGTSIGPDDNSSLVAFGGNKIGVMWSNQTTASVGMWFAVHVDGKPDGVWEVSRTAIQGSGSADDHINLKSLQADGSGRVYAAVKTSFTTAAAPLIMLLARDAATGNWSSYPIARVSDCPNRPLVLIDEENGVLHAYYTAPASPNFTCHEGGAIYEKTSPLDAPSFPRGYGTPVIQDANSAEVNNVSSTKQNVTSATGLLVLAANSTTQYYWHAYRSIAPGTPSTADFTGNPTAGAAPLTVSFADTSTGSPTSWSWDFGDGTTSTEQNPKHAYTAPGTYTVSLRVANALGSSTATKSDYVTVTAPPPPTADFTGDPTTGSRPLTVTFTDTSSAIPTSWSWDFGDGTTSTAQDPIHTYTIVGTYTVSLTVSSAYGADMETKSGYVVVEPAPSPTADFTGTPASGVSPLVVDFTDRSTGSPTTWLWDFGDGASSTVQAPSHTYTTPGVYTVALTVANESGTSTSTRAGYVSVSQRLTFTPSADSEVVSAKPTKNYGATTSLRVRGGSSTNYRSYLRFAVSGVTGAIQSAKLRLCVTDQSNDGGMVYKSDGSWEESTITWNTAPTITGDPTARIGAASPAGVCVEADVMSAVSGNGTVNLALAKASSNTAGYSSREGSSPPQLIVTVAP